MGGRGGSGALEMFPAAYQSSAEPAEYQSAREYVDTHGQSEKVFTLSRSEWEAAGEYCKFTTAAHHSPTLVKGNCPLSLLVCLASTRLYRNPS